MRERGSTIMTPTTPENMFLATLIDQVSTLSTNVSTVSQDVAYIKGQLQGNMRSETKVHEIAQGKVDRHEKERPHLTIADIENNCKYGIVEIDRKKTRKEFWKAFSVGVAKKAGEILLVTALALMGLVITANSESINEIIKALYVR